MIRLASLLLVSALAAPAAAVLAFNTDVTPDTIFGSGNSNGAWSTSTENGVELGLRAKLRYDVPAAVYNFSGTAPVGTGAVPYGVYKFPTGSRTGDSNRPIWNFEFSINTDVDGTSGKKLNDLTYFLTFQQTSGGSVFVPFGDVINVPYADHSIGDNSTPNDGGAEAPSGDTVAYASLIDNNNVAQQSWNIDFFSPDFDPSVLSETRITLSAFDSTLVSGTNPAGFVGQAGIIVQAVPEPTAALFGSLLVGGMGMTIARRRRSQSDED